MQLLWREAKSGIYSYGGVHIERSSPPLPIPAVDTFSTFLEPGRAIGNAKNAGLHDNGDSQKFNSFSLEYGRAITGLDAWSFGAPDEPLKVGRTTYE